MVKKSDKIDKLEALWHPRNVALPPEDDEVLRSTYVNESAQAAYHRHYESPIRLRNRSVASSSENELEISNSRPQSYIDMQAGGKVPETDDLLTSFGNSKNDLVDNFGAYDGNFN